MNPEIENNILTTLERIDLSTRETAKGIADLVEMMSERREPTLPQSRAGSSPLPVAGWRGVPLPRWARYDAGVPLGQLGVKSLDYWLKWQPRPWTKDDGTQMPPNSADVALRKSLDEAQAEIAAGTYVPPQFSPRSDKPRERSSSKPPASDSRPADGAKDKPAQREDNTGDNPDEDVPF